MWCLPRPYLPGTRESLSPTATGTDQIVMLSGVTLGGTELRASSAPTRRIPKRLFTQNLMSSKDYCRCLRPPLQ
jgi:hypothetical protein